MPAVLIFNTTNIRVVGPQESNGSELVPELYEREVDCSSWTLSMLHNKGYKSGSTWSSGRAGHTVQGGDRGRALVY